MEERFAAETQLERDYSHCPTVLWLTALQWWLTYDGFNLLLLRLKFIEI